MHSLRLDWWHLLLHQQSYASAGGHTSSNLWKHRAGKHHGIFRSVVKYCCQRHQHQKTHLFFQKTASGKVYHRNPHVSVHVALRHETWCKQKSLRFLFWSPSFAWSLAPVAEYISQLGPSTSFETLALRDLQRCWISIQYLNIRQQPCLNKQQKPSDFTTLFSSPFSMGTKISKVHAIQRPRTLRDLNDLDYPGAPKKSFLLHPGKTPQNPFNEATPFVWGH